MLPTVRSCHDKAGIRRQLGAAARPLLREQQAGGLHNSTEEGVSSRAPQLAGVDCQAVSCGHRSQTGATCKWQSAFMSRHYHHGQSNRWACMCCSCHAEAVPYLRTATKPATAQSIVKQEQHRFAACLKHQQSDAVPQRLIRPIDRSGGQEAPKHTQKIIYRKCDSHAWTAGCWTTAHTPPGCLLLLYELLPVSAFNGNH